MIQACLNGRRLRTEHPAIPITPADLAREGKAAVAAGATSLHVHPRGPDGFETMEAEPRAAVLLAMRGACPGIEISFTTGLWIVRDVPRRLEMVADWTELPDLATVNISEPGAVDLCRALVDRGIGVELGLANAGDARFLVDTGIAPQCRRLLIEAEGEASEALVEIAAIDAVLYAAQIDMPRMEHGYGRATWAIVDRASRLGFDVRIGLEDTLVLASGHPARHNAELVGQCRSRVEAAAVG